MRSEEKWYPTSAVRPASDATGRFPARSCKITTYFTFIFICDSGEERDVLLGDLGRGESRVVIRFEMRLGL